METNIDFNFIDVEIPDFNSEFFCLWLSGIATNHGKQIGELTYVFCTDEYLLDMNKSYLNHDYYTDIITFNYNEENSLSGDLFISYDRVVDNAKDLGFSVDDELSRVIVHGLLHLIGFDDKTDEDQERMTEEENKSLALRKSFT
ncbi:rRNA maturation RNase YbeY [Crocinitomix catalasitica]|uniref:rRNA maturation RNase YbeY n=1 Tax=Crocinitomix catalasitica TaxID=184607 RepID=UPI000A0173B0|nr:rRNA maturation RNase YbeY [Crocinitomix catalasitica]